MILASRIVVAGAVLALVSTTNAGQAPGPTIPGIGNPASECFVTLRDLQAVERNVVECFEGDPSCDIDGEANGRCTFYVRVCVAQEIPGCQATTITSVRARPKRLGIPVPPVPASSPSCGDQTRITVPLTKNGTKKGRLRIVLTASNAGKPHKEKDQVKINGFPPSTTAPPTTPRRPCRSSDARYQPNTYANINGATIDASDSMMNFGVSATSLPHVIFSFGTAPE
jgi:hypothetical protein